MCTCLQQFGYFILNLISLERSIQEQDQPLRMDYTLKRGFKPDLERIQKALEEEFPTEIKQEDGKLLLSYGALKSICVSITGKKLTVTTESVIGADDVVAMDTNKHFRNFLEKATGYNAKQRLQMAKKEVTKGA
jgi:hypothetical protein